MRELTYSEDEDITVDYLKAKATQVFFPQGVSTFGDLSEMNLKMGNFAQNSISSFKDTTGMGCTFHDYLRSHGIFASKSHMYLMSSISTDDEDNVEGKDSEDLPLMLLSNPPTSKETSADGNVFIGCSKSKYTNRKHIT